MVYEDGFTVEEAGGPGDLEGLGGDFDVGGMATCSTDTASTDETAEVGTAGRGGLEGAGGEAEGGGVF